MPGHRALAAAGQTDRPGAQVRPAAGTFGQMTQGDVPAAVGRAVFIEIDAEEHGRTDQQPWADQDVGGTDLLIGELLQVDHPIEHRLELGKQHFLADTGAPEEHDCLDHLRFVLHARHPWPPAVGVAFSAAAVRIRAATVGSAKFRRKAETGNVIRLAAVRRICRVGRAVIGNAIGLAKARQPARQTPPLCSRRETSERSAPGQEAQPAGSLRVPGRAVRPRPTARQRPDGNSELSGEPAT